MAEYISPYDLRKLTLERRRKLNLIEKKIKKKEGEKEKDRKHKEEELKRVQMQRELLLQQRRELRVDEDNTEHVAEGYEHSVFDYEDELNWDLLDITGFEGFEEGGVLYDSTHEEKSIANSLLDKENLEASITLSKEIERLDMMLDTLRHESGGVINEEDVHKNVRDNTLYKERITSDNRETFNENPEQIKYYDSTGGNSTAHHEKERHIVSDRVQNSVKERSHIEENPTNTKDKVQSETVEYNRSQRRSQMDDDIVKLEEEIDTLGQATSKGYSGRYGNPITEETDTHAQLMNRWRELGKKLDEENNRELLGRDECKRRGNADSFQPETKTFTDKEKLPHQRNPTEVHKRGMGDQVNSMNEGPVREMSKRRNSTTRYIAKVKREAEHDRIEELQRQKDEIDRQLREETLERDKQLKNEQLEREENIRQAIKEYKEKKIREKIEQLKKAEAKREKQKQEEREIMTRIERLKMREKDIDRKNREKEELHRKSKADLEDQLMENRLKALNQEEEEILKRIHDKEEKDKPCNVEKENKMLSETDMFSKLEKTIIGKPYLPSFEGSQFEEWKLEVSCLLKSGLYPDYLVAQLVRNSLKGKTRRVLLTLQPGASAREILQKIESVYGNVRSGDSLIHDFYSAKQSPNESCTDWGIRIETLFYQALDKGEVEESRNDSKLKERFWRGLYLESLKNATRVTYESSDSFEKLRKKARLEEVESDTGTDNKKEIPVSEITEDKTTLPKIHQPIRTSETDSKLNMILEKMKGLEKEVKELKRRQNTDDMYRRNNDSYSQSRGRDRYRGNTGYRYRGRGYRSPSNHNRNRLEPENERIPKQKPEQKQGNSDRKDKESDKKEKSLNG